jgi:hypothetical protein
MYMNVGSSAGLRHYQTRRFRFVCFFTRHTCRSSQHLPKCQRETPANYKNKYVASDRIRGSQSLRFRANL